MANTGQHFNNSFFYAGSVWWSVLEKLHGSLHCQTHLKTRPFTVGWVVLGKGHEKKKKKKRPGSSLKKYLPPGSILPVRTSVQCLFKKRGKKHRAAKLFSTLSRWMVVCRWLGTEMYPRKQLFKMHLVSSIFALLWFGLNWSGRPDLENSRMWVSINIVPGAQAWRGAVPLII